MRPPAPRSARKKGGFGVQNQSTDDPSECFECVGRLYEMMAALSTRLHDHPSWSAFILEGEERINTQCMSCNSNIWPLMTVRKYPNYDVMTPFGSLELEIGSIESEKIPLKVFPSRA